MKDEKLKEAFLAAIKADRYDAASRKVFADWLEENGEDDEALIQRAWTADRQRAAEAHFQKFAEECELSTEELLVAAGRYLDTGRGHTLPFDTPDMAYDDPRGFWEHFMVLTGRPVPDGKRDDVFFRCAC